MNRLVSILAGSLVFSSIQVAIGDEVPTFYRSSITETHVGDWKGVAWCNSDAGFTSSELKFGVRLTNPSHKESRSIKADILLFLYKTEDNKRILITKVMLSKELTATAIDGQFLQIDSLANGKSLERIISPSKNSWDILFLNPFLSDKKLGWKEFPGGRYSIDIVVATDDGRLLSFDNLKTTIFRSRSPYDLKNP